MKLWEVNNMAGSARKTKYKGTFFSYSKICDFLFCPKKYEHIYVNRLPEPRNVYKDYGLKIHEVDEKLGKIEAFEEVHSFLVKNGLSEQDVQRGMAHAEFLSKYYDILSEFRFELKLARGYNLEFHIDKIFWDEFGMCYIHDTKTSPQPIGEEEIQADFQLDMYAWAFVTWLRQNKADFVAERNKLISFIKDSKKEQEKFPPQSEERLDLMKYEFAIQAKLNAYDRMIHTADTGEVKIGIWLWRYCYKVETKWEYSDKTAGLMYTIEKMKSAKAFTPKANRFCVDCPYFKTCNPQPILNTYNEVKDLENHYKALAEKKKEELLFDANQLGVNIIEEKDATLVIKETASKKYDTEQLLEKFLDPDTFDVVKKSGVIVYLNADSTEVNRELKKKTPSFAIEPFSISTSIKLSRKTKLPEEDI